MLSSSLSSAPSDCPTEYDFFGKSRGIIDGNERYTLSQVRTVLSFGPRFIDFNLDRIFLTTANTGLSVLKQMTKDGSLLDFERRNLEAKQSLMSFAAAVNATSSSDAGLSHSESFVLERKLSELSITDVTPHDWAVMCKWAMLRGNVLDRTSKKVNASLRVLMFHLRSKEMDAMQISQYFKEFLGQLCHIGQLESAEVIHLYIKLACQVLAHADRNNMDRAKTAMTMGPSLLEGLSLYGQIIERSGDELEEPKIQAQEYRFFSKFLEALLQDPIFRQDFSPALYSAFAQKEFAVELIQVKRLMIGSLWGEYAPRPIPTVAPITLTACSSDVSGHSVAAGSRPSPYPADYTVVQNPIYGPQYQRLLQCKKTIDSTSSAAAAAAAATTDAIDLSAPASSSSGQLHRSFSKKFNNHLRKK